MPLILRSTKGSALTNAELDGNFFDLDVRVNSNNAAIGVINDVTIPNLAQTISTSIGEKQPLNANLTSLSNNTVLGFLSQTSEGNITPRTIQVSGSHINISDGDGVAGNPTISIDTTQIVTKSGTYVLTNKSISGTTNTLTNISLNTSVVGVLPVVHGGTGSTSIPNARIALNVLERPSSLGFVVANSPYQSVSRILQVAGLGLTIVHADGQLNNPSITLASSSTNLPNTVVYRDASGNFSAGTITATLDGVAKSATEVANGVYSNLLYNNPSWIQSLAGSKITNIPNSSLVNSSISVNGTSVPLGGNLTIDIGLLGGTSANTPSTLVARDNNGSFSANIITADLVGTATNALSADQATVAQSITGSKINGVAFTGVNDIVVGDNTKLPLVGGTLTGDLFIRDYKGLYLQSNTPTSYLRITKDSSNQGLIKNWSGDLTIAAEDYVNLIFDHQGSYGGLRIGKQQTGDGAFTTLMEVNLSGKLSTALTATAYQALLTDGKDIPNKKYVDDKVASLTSISSATTATRLDPGAKINGVLFTGQTDITIGDNTKLPLVGGTLTGDLYLRDYKGLYLQSNTPTSYLRITKDSNNQGLIKNWSGDLTIAAEDYVNLIFDHQGSYGGLRIGKQQSGDGAFTTLMTVNLDGKLSTALTATAYQALLTDGKDIPNKKYVDDKVAGLTSISSATTATRLDPGAKINGVLFTGQTDIVVDDSTKLPLIGGTLTGDLYLRDYKGLYLQSNTATSYLRITKDSNNRGLIKNWSGDLTIAAEDYINLIFDHQGSYGGLRIGKQQTGDGAFTTLMEVDLSGKLSTALTATAYQALLTDGRDIPNKKYVDDKVAGLTSISSAATAARLDPGAKINGVLFTGQTDIVVDDNTKLPLVGGTLTGDLYLRDYKGLYLQSNTATSYLRITKDSSNQGLIKNWSGDLTIAAEDYINLIFDHQGSYGGLRIGKQQSGDGTFTTLMEVNLSGKLSTALTATAYQALLTDGRDIPNKKYVDDKFNNLTSTSSATTAARLDPGAKINGVLFTGQTDITIGDNTKLPLVGGTLTGDLFIRDYKGLYLQSNTPTSYLRITKDSNNQGLIKNWSGDLTIAAEDYVNLIFDHQGSYGGLRIGKQQSGDGTFTTLMEVNLSGKLSTALTAAAYQALLTDGKDIPNKKYVDDKVAGLTSISSAATAARLDPGAKINGVLFTGQTDITIGDNTKLPLVGGTLTGDLFIRDYKGLYLQSSTPTSYLRITKDSNNEGLIKNWSGDLTIAAEDYINLIFDHQGSYGGLRIGKQQSGDGAFTTLMTVNLDGKLSTALTAAAYQALLTDGKDIPNKKYVDDKFNNLTSTSSATTAARLDPGAKINGVLFTGQTDITIGDNTKLPLVGGTLTGDLYLRDYKGLYLQSSTPTSYLRITKDSNNQGLIKNWSGDLTIAAEDYVNLIFDHQGSYGGLRIGKQQSGDGAFTTLMEVNLSGKLSTALTATAYQALLTDGRDIPNKKYVDDKVANVTTSTTSARLSPGANINGVLFTGQTDITVYDSSKVPIDGHTTIPVTGSLKAKSVEHVVNETATTSSGYLNVDWKNGTVFKFTATANFTLAQPVDMPVGSYITILVVQDSVGNRLMTVPSQFKFASGYKTLSTAPASEDIISIFKYSNNFYYATLSTSYS